MLTRRAFIGGAAKALAALGLARALPAAGATEPDWLEIEGERLASDPVADNVLWEGLDSLVPEGDSPVLTEEALARAWRPTGEPATVVADETRAMPPLDAARERWPDVDWEDAFAVEVERPHTLVMAPYLNPASAPVGSPTFSAVTIALEPYGDWMLGKGWIPTDPVPVPPGYDTSYHWRPVLAWRRAA